MCRSRAKLKSQKKIEKNILDNFERYDKQIWIVPSIKSKIAKILQENATNYPNIELIELSQIQVENSL